jgi:hypothetical protein
MLIHFKFGHFLASLFVCILIHKLVNLRIRFYSQELLFFMYDISLPDTDISYYRVCQKHRPLVFYIVVGYMIGVLLLLVGARHHRTKF